MYVLDIKEVALKECNKKTWDAYGQIRGSKTINKKKELFTERKERLEEAGLRRGGLVKNPDLNSDTLFLEGCCGHFHCPAPFS